MSLTRVYMCDEQGCEETAVSRKRMHEKGWCEIEPISEDVHYCSEHHPMNEMESWCDCGDSTPNKDGVCDTCKIT